VSDQSRRAAGILAQCKWLRDQIAVWERQAKGVIASELEGGERTKAVAADGTVIGAVTRAEGARSMQIDNEEGFLMWVKSRYPHEVVETVRPAFIKLCAEKVKVLGGLPDANGELCPHVSLVRGEPTISAKLGDQDKAVIADMFMHRHMPEVMADMEPKAIEPPGAYLTIEEYEAARKLVAQGDSAVAGVIHEAEGYAPQQEYEADRIAQQYLEATTPVSNETPVGTFKSGVISSRPGTEQDLPDAEPEPEPTGWNVYPADPEPFIEEGPPNWPESNTFETSAPVHQRRREE
jgi:hypothetical protein